VIQSDDRDGLRERLLERGVETLIHYPRPVHKHPAYATLAREGGLPVSELLSSRIASLPPYPELRDDEVAEVVAAVRAVA
jgi:dTDP-4-amino-4,6-dideoxygalactose transaminase